MDIQSVAFVAGRSGGHIIPALTLGRDYKKQFPQSSILFFTTTHSLDRSIIAQHGNHVDAHYPLSLSNVPWYNPFKFIFFIGALGKTFFQSRALLKRHRPSHVVAMGGYICIPVCLAAKVVGIPVHLYDLDTQPGKATRFLKPFASKIFVCFAHARAFFPAQKTTLVPYPVRFTDAAQNMSAESAKQSLQLHPTKKVIFINGGSQGSVLINRTIKKWLELNPHVHTLIQIIHQTGATDTTNWQQLYAEYDIPAVVFAYRPDLAPCYAASDLIITRAGAGSLFEALFFKKSCVIIPLETSSTSHQKNNALAMVAQHPELMSMLTEQEIAQDNTKLFNLLNKHIYAVNVHAPRTSGTLEHTH